jgi:hypothetical protein
MVVLWIIAVGSACWWLWQAWGMVRILRSVPTLEPSGAGELDEVVSIICPARDEADEIEAAMRTRLSDPSPQLEFIAVDDRSTDGTGEILDRLAKDEPRLQVVHLTECPDGWLGKVHAQQRGIDVSTGEWLLFSDGDTHVEPGMMAAAIAHAEHEGADLLAVLPRIVGGPWMLRVGLVTLMRMLLGALRLWDANRDDRERVMGVGAFNLVRREALERAGGMGELRMEIADDAGLAHIVAQAGGRVRLASSSSGVWIRWYRTTGDLMRGTEKGCAKAGSRAKLFYGLSLMPVLLTLEVSPFVLWAWWPASPAIIAAAAAVIAVATCQVSAWRFALPRGWALLVPVSTIITAVLLTRAMSLAIIRGGIRWKGDAHSLAEARAGEKVQM